MLFRIALIIVATVTILPGVSGLVAPPSVACGTHLSTWCHRLDASNDHANDGLVAKTDRVTSDSTYSSLEWLSLGMSGIYLAHFSSLYTQLPGLFGPTGLLPIADRFSGLSESLWALNLVPSPELGMEAFTVLGIVVSFTQITFRQARHGILGILTFGLEWILWHDSVIAGGRFMAYQMDLLLLDAAPLTVLAASGLSPAASTYGYRWLLSRLYLGAGAVKLLSCDSSWRNLSAVHWHFQSQPLPNPIGAGAYLHLPEGIGQVITLAVLVLEMAAPFMFLAPSQGIRRVAFVLNILLMVGIALFGNFGPLQAVLIVFGFALLDDLPPLPESVEASESIDGKQQRNESIETDTSISAKINIELGFSSAVTAVSVSLAAWATLWTLHDVGARCLDTWAVEPLVYGLTAVGAAAACLPLFQSTANSTVAGAVSLAIFLGSATTMAAGLGVGLPFGNAFEYLNFGASPYGLFAIITGVNARPVAVIEAAQSLDGPWRYVSLLYQVNDPAASLPLCFPHFPRLDWTLWFIPFGEQGLWIARFFNGIVNNDPAVMRLVDGPVFRQTFPTDQPSIVRVVPRKYSLDGKGWLVSEDSRYSGSPVLATFTKGDLNEERDVQPWPSTPLIRRLSYVARPEYFVWGCLGTAEATRRTVQPSKKEDGREENV